MLGFREYLLEDYDETIEGKRGSKYYSINHSSDVGPHKLGISHVITTVRGRKHMETDFDIGGSLTSRGDVSPEHSNKIFSIVRRSTKNVLESEKPDRITFHGNTERKDRLYGKFAQSIARLHGGTYKRDGELHHVTFKRQ